MGSISNQGRSPGEGNVETTMPQENRFVTPAGGSDSTLLSYSRKGYDFHVLAWFSTLTSESSRNFQNTPTRRGRLVMKHLQRLSFLFRQTFSTSGKKKLLFCFQLHGRQRCKARLTVTNFLECLEHFIEKKYLPGTAVNLSTFMPIFQLSTVIS